MANSKISDHGARRICYDCIGETFLSKLVKEKGKRKKCSYCDITRKTVLIEELADKVQTVIEKFYRRTSDQPDPYQSHLLADKESDYTWFREGEAITDVIENDLLAPREAAEDVQYVLQKRFYSRSQEEIGEESEFDEEAHYEFIGVESKTWEVRWIEFENSLKKNSRFFNQLGKDYLDEVFKNINELKTRKGTPVVFVGPEHNIKSVYRARVFLSDEVLENALHGIVENIGPPHPQLANAGRMNANGISVFYGAMDEHTALSEVRPPVGSKVLVAKFLFTRRLQLLNLLELKDIKALGSLFDEEFADLFSRVQFLKQICEKMTTPVMPGDENTEYLITQAIADYLSTNTSINLDGIIFPSIQTKDGSNIILFNKASKVEQRRVPEGSEISVTLYENGENGLYPSFGIFEETPIEEIPNKSSKPDNDLRITSLRISDDDIKIHLVRHVQYKTEAHDLSIRRYKKANYDGSIGSKFSW